MSLHKFFAVEVQFILPMYLVKYKPLIYETKF
jgi:hypothetical protein